MSQQTQKKDTLPSVKTGDMIYMIKSNNGAKQLKDYLDRAPVDTPNCINKDRNESSGRY